MSHRPSPSQREGGFALVLSLILTTVVAGLCIGFVRLAEFTARGQTGAVDQMRAFYLAEAGLAEAFNAVRMGRTGALGSEELPATYGDGLVWVESRQTDDRRVWLRSTATVRTGSATLGLIINPEEPPLGFFADEALIIESTLLIDGFDSTTRSYEDEIAAIQALNSPAADPTESYFKMDPDSDHHAAQGLANRFARLLGPTTLLAVLNDQFVEQVSSGDDTANANPWLLYLTPVNLSARLESSDYSVFLESCYKMKLALNAGALVPVEPDGLVGTRDIIANSTLQDASADKAGSADLSLLNVEGTGRGGLLGSNGNIEFLNSQGAAIFGAVVPGIGGQVVGLGASQASGSTDSRALEAELPQITLPNIVGAGNLEHVGLIPHVIGEGETRLESLRIGEGSEVVIRGPATLMVHDLVLDGGSTLSLDTRDGDVELFVTGTLDMDPASYVETTALTSAEVSISAVAMGESDPSPSLRLDAQSKFHGTVHAPDAAVYIGSNFEVFGSITARQIEIASGARLHFDDESYNSQLAVPTLDAWQILDLPDSVRAVKSTGTVPAAQAASVSLPLATAHVLADVDISLRYTDSSGMEQSYAGPESGVDWNDVKEVEAQERHAKFEESDAESESHWGAGFRAFLEGLADWLGSFGG